MRVLSLCGPRISLPPVGFDFLNPVLPPDSSDVAFATWRTCASYAWLGCATRLRASPCAITLAKLAARLPPSLSASPTLCSGRPPRNPQRLKTRSRCPRLRSRVRPVWQGVRCARLSNRAFGATAADPFPAAPGDGQRRAGAGCRLQPAAFGIHPDQSGSAGVDDPRLRPRHTAVRRFRSA